MDGMIMPPACLIMPGAPLAPGTQQPPPPQTPRDAQRRHHVASVAHQVLGQAVAHHTGCKTDSKELRASVQYCCRPLDRAVLTHLHDIGLACQQKNIVVGPFLSCSALFS